MASLERTDQSASIDDEVSFPEADGDNRSPSIHPFEIDMDGNFTKVPGFLEKVTGFSSEELDLLSLLNITFIDDRAGLIEAILSVADGEQLVVREIELFSEEKGSYSLIVILFPGRPDHDAESIQGAFLDIVGRRELEERILNLEKQRDRSEKQLSGFISLFSRELRQPLTVLRLILDIMMSGKIGPVSDEMNDKMKIMDDELEKLKGTINKTLEMSRDIWEGRDLDRRPVSIGHLIDGVLGRRESEFRDKDIKLTSNTPQKDREVVLDEKAIAQVMDTFIQNAITSTLQGGHILIDMEDHNGDIIFSVSDSGEGLSEEEQESIFDRVNAEQDSNGEEFLGDMSLYISKRIIEGHGGRIWVESFIGLGSTLFFSLPMQGVNL